MSTAAMPQGETWVKFCLSALRFLMGCTKGNKSTLDNSPPLLLNLKSLLLPQGQIIDVKCEKWQ